MKELRPEAALFTIHFSYKIVFDEIKLFVEDLVIYIKISTQPFISIIILIFLYMKRVYEYEIGLIYYPVKGNHFAVVIFLNILHMGIVKYTLILNSNTYRLHTTQAAEHIVKYVCVYTIYLIATKIMLFLTS